MHAAPTLTGVNSQAVAEELGHGLLSCRSAGPSRRAGPRGRVAAAGG